jgi:uncharacterized membrane protein YcfT
MEKVVILSVAISVLFFAYKVFEMKYVDKESKPLKVIVRDTIVVFTCVFIPMLLFFQFDGKMNEIFNMGDAPAGPTKVFTGEPGF